MAEHVTQPSSGNGHGALYFIVGALVVAIGILAYFLFADRNGGNSDINVKVDVPKVELQK
jgi:hypothetical protein